MLSEINWNEERYIKARLDELPSWVETERLKRAVRMATSFFLLCCRPGILSRCGTRRVGQSNHQAGLAVRQQVSRSSHLP